MIKHDKSPDALTTGCHSSQRVVKITVGFPMSLVVTECEPFRRLAWATTVDGDETGSSAYHGWVITPTSEGCHVLTEETQQGPWFLEMLGRQHPGGLYRYHQQWVECLARAAEAEVSHRRNDTAVG
ncbi:SRPBCC family protein [Erwinia typographi]|uniref:hypothetical protein n=1 Tax=Erwinia typographi TaxID=371042 RepID=UPI001E34A6D2|nr:hypothetical protein [Erwinia typographi]